MKKLSIFALCLTAALAGPAAAEAQAPLVEMLTVSESITVTADAPRSLTLGCPGTSVAVSGSVTTGLGTLTDSIPRRGASHWTFRFTSPGGSHEVTGVLRCVRLNLPGGVDGVRLVVGSAVEPGVLVAAGKTERVAVGCPADQVPTGWGFKRISGGNSIAVTAAAPSQAGWVFKLENRGSSAARVTPRIRCLASTQRASSGQRHSFSLRAASFVDRIDAGANEAEAHACRATEYSLSTGVSLDSADDILLKGTYPAGLRGGRWSFRQANGQSTVKTTLLCLASDTSFH